MCLAAGVPHQLKGIHIANQACIEYQTKTTDLHCSHCSCKRKDHRKINWHNNRSPFFMECLVACLATAYPQRRCSFYITPEGMAALRAELHQLCSTERPVQVTAVVHEAAKNGDRSENGDYIYGKRRLREIDSRVRFLGKRIDQLEVVEQLPADQSKVYFGAWVTVEDEDGDTVT